MPHIVEAVYPPVLISVLAGSKQSQKKANDLNYYHVFQAVGL